MFDWDLFLILFFRLNNSNIEILIQEKKTKTALYTPARGQFDEGNPDEYFFRQNRIITLDNLRMNLPSKY